LGFTLGTLSSMKQMRKQAYQAGWRAKTTTLAAASPSGDKGAHKKAGAK